MTELTHTRRGAILSACAEMIRACGLTLAEIAQELGQPLQAAPIALPPGERLDLTGRPRLQQTLELADNPDGISVPEIQALWGVGHQTAWMYLDELHRGLHVVRVKAPGVRGSRYFRDPGHASRWVDSHARACAAVMAATPAPAPAPVVEAAPAPALPPAPFPEPAPAAAPAVATLTAAEVRTIEIHQAKVAGSKKAPAPMGARMPHKPTPTAKQNVTIVPPKPPEATKPKGEAIRTEKTVEIRDTTVRPIAKWQMQDLPPDPRYPSFSSMRPGTDPRTGLAWGSRA